MKHLICITLLITFILSSTILSQETFHYGIKGGISLWSFVLLKNNPHSIEPKYPEYTYPIGLATGIFIENEMIQNLSIVNELLYQKNISKITIDTPIEDIMDQKVTMQFINVPVLIKYKMQWLAEAYVFLGPSFSYLIKADYDYQNRINIGEDNIDITSELPKISMSLELGIGKEFLISQMWLLAEIRAQLSITKFKYEDIYYRVGNWHNAGIEFLIGIRL